MNVQKIIYIRIILSKFSKSYATYFNKIFSKKISFLSLIL